jgi:hypothetical protein
MTSYGTPISAISSAQSAMTLHGFARFAHYHGTMPMAVLYSGFSWYTSYLRVYYDQLGATDGFSVKVYDFAQICTDVPIPQ